MLEKDSEKAMRLEEDTSEAELEALVAEASSAAIRQTLARGVSVFYLENNVLVREDADGRRFEVKHREAKRGAYDVIRELK
jgi:hypothetical protein